MRHLVFRDLVRCKRVRAPTSLVEDVRNEWVIFFSVPLAKVQYHFSCKFYQSVSGESGCAAAQKGNRIVRHCRVQVSRRSECVL